MAASTGFPGLKAGEIKAPSNPYQMALERLAPLEPLLAGFNRRNKSQHRRSRWWASFDMLRRGLTKFLLELLAAARSRAANSPEISGAGSSGKKDNPGKPKKKKYEDQYLVDSANERARWLRDVLLQKCYLQFSQLTADNQFATLGVVLLGVLGQVRESCCGVVGDLAEEVGEEDGMIAVTTPATDVGITGREGVMGGKISRESVAGGSVVPRDGLAIRQGGGSGGVISREDAAARFPVVPRNRDLKGASPAGESENEVDDEYPEKKTKSAKSAITKRKRDEEDPSSTQKQAKINAASHESSDDMSSIAKDEPQILEKKNKKKTEKTPNDISAIFSSTSSRPSKKVKRPVTEEDDSNSIDNIFASTTASKTKTKSKEKVKPKSSEEDGPVDDMKKSKKKKKKAGKGNEFDDMFSSLF